MQYQNTFLGLCLLVLGDASGQTLFPTEPRLWPAGGFDLASKLRAAGTADEAVVIGMLANEGSLFFLVKSSSGMPEYKLVRTSITGEIKYVVRLGEGDVLDWAATEGHGALVEIDDGGSPPQLRRYGSNGELSGASPVARDLYRPAAAASSPLKITRSGAIIAGEDTHRRAVGQFELNSQSAFSTYTLSLPSDRLAVVDATRATITFVDLRSGATSTATLDHPEVGRVRQTYQNAPAGMTGLTIIAAATDSSGNIYCMLAGFRPEEGAPVIVLDAAGRPRGLFRCPVQNATNRKAMAPSMMALTSGEIFIGDSAGTVLSYYLKTY